MSVSLRQLAAADWPEVHRVYAEGIATGHATFETAPPAAWDDFDGAKLAAHRLVVGVRERIARDAAGIWRDTVLIERRSPTVT